MFKNNKIYIFFGSLLALLVGSAVLANNLNLPLTGNLTFGQSEDDDTTQDKDKTEARWGVARTVPDGVQELQQSHPGDLRNPKNVTEAVEYDWKNDRYLVKTKIGDQQIGYTIPMTRREYMNYTERTVRAAYFKEQYSKAYEEFENEGGNSLLDHTFSLGPAEKIFGKGGVRVRTQGSASISMGMKRNKIDNPQLSERARDQLTFDFKEDIQLNMNASIGSKMSFNLNYNTEATFDFDANQFKLAYQGDEDEIIQDLEAGNVSMTTGNSLITGGQALFGIKSALKFGKLNITALLAKQNSTSKSVSSKGGSTKRSFEITADQYDENRHFFLAHYFRDTYDGNMSRLPLIASGVEIKRIEVWVTNKRASFGNARNILAFMDLGESENIGNDRWTNQSTTTYPDNNANDLYQTVTTTYSAIRDITNVTTTLASLEAEGCTGGTDFEKVESARRLESTEYTLNSNLGYISLKSKLDDDMVLAVAFQYTLGGKTYQVGEFSDDNAEDKSQTLVLKLLKATSGNPATPLWDLMMKNVYSLGVSSLQKKNFSLQVQYMSDTIGVYTNFLNEGPIAQKLLVKVMNLDQLNANQERHPDGQFDFIEGLTVNAATGRIIFPVVEPFGSHLARELGNSALAHRYCYQELYDSTLTVAQQIAEKNKFRLRGDYEASSGAEIDLGARNVARGSVVVTAGGATLVENRDYSVDYNMGIVTILNENIIESGTQVNVSLEDQSYYSLQRKTMMGVDLQYEYSKDISFGATLINLHEKPLTKKVTNADIPINNTMYGFNFKWNKDFMWLTNAVGAIPWVKATAPSNIAIQGEFANLVAGHNHQIGEAGNVYIDDFENSESSTPISSVSHWHLASTPYEEGNAAFPEAALSNDIDYGKNRALLSWYSIDHMFTSQSSNQTPSHIKNDLEQLSDHRVRQVNFDEIYPNKELTYGETGILDVLNLSYYPAERGPYNLDAEGMTKEGLLSNPEKRWGGIMTALDVTNFENANYEYIEFWLMDPTLTSNTSGEADEKSYTGGDLYFNLGEVSEDILKDGMKSFENGLDADGTDLYTTETAWGRVSRRTSTVYAFDNQSGSRDNQDVGLDGLKDANEMKHTSYANYRDAVMGKVNSSVLEQWQNDPFSPINDPAGDDFHHFRGSDLDNQKASILERYKHYNGMEGNSNNDNSNRYSTAATSVPDVEDINQDNTLNEYERYYQYHISLRPEDLNVGSNHIASISESSVQLRNGKRQKVKWYQFRIPISEYDKKVGNIQNFKSIRFMRMYLTGWSQAQTLRFATLELVRSDWRNYTASRLNERGYNVAGTGTISTSTVNIEENAGSYPVNYVLPPGIDRVVDPGQSTATQLNEQAMVLEVSDLEPHDAVAVYKNSGMDMRQYETLQLFVHGEALAENMTQLGDGDLSIFVRLGADYKDNYYEYEVPIRLTPAGSYNNNSPSDRALVWPEDNMVNVSLRKFTELKKERNSKKQGNLGETSYTTLYSTYDENSRGKKLSVIGNPSLSEVSVIMIGVRNNGKNTKSGKIWVNELRLNGIDEGGGWATKGNATLRVSDIATFNAAGNYTSVGWGNITQSAADRSQNEDWQYNVSGQTDIGKWLPSQLKFTAPFYYSRGKAVSTPKYDPYNEDLLMEETLETYQTEREKDSIRALVQTVETTNSMSITGMRFNVKSKKSKPWDPANVSVSYSQNRKMAHDPTTEYEKDETYRASINYQYSPFFKPWQPFDKGGKSKKDEDEDNDQPSNNAGSKNKKKNSFRQSKFLKDFQLNWLPNSISLSSNWNRTYHEEQLRNIETYESDYTIPVSYTKSFTWLRQTAIAWDLTKSLKMNFNAATNARIDEPDAPVNKNLYPDEFEAWKDTISLQLWKLGTPVTYNQTFDATWNIPINKIPYTDWLNATLRYKGSYEWQRGSQIDEETETGGTLQNDGQWQGELRFNFETLYNKSPFLKKTNDRFKTKTNNSRSLGRKEPAKKNKKKKNFNKTISLSGDTTVILTHNLKTRRIILNVKDVKTGKSVDLKYKRVDADNIKFSSHDSVKLNITIAPMDPLDDVRWYKNAQTAARVLMTVRSFDVTYKQTNTTVLPSYRLNAGDFFGQNNSGPSLSPGLGFAFGFEGGEEFTEKAIQNDWLIIDSTMTTPAVYSVTKDLNYRTTLEPLPGLKINLSGTWKHNEKQSHQFMFNDLAITKSGSFQMTTIALGIGRSGSSKNHFSSKAFDQFVASRDIIYQRILDRYRGTNYPVGNFLSEMPDLAGTPYQSALGNSRINSSDVLVPAFISAYMKGGSASEVSLSAFPSMWKALPNWKMQYDGLLQIFPKLADHFKSISLSHGYTCTYNVGNYTSYTNYAENEDGLGFTLDVSNNVPVPSAEFNITSVTLSESYAPLAGVNVTFLNGMSLRSDYKTTRAVSLNMSAAQIVENLSKDLTIGAGYKIANFNTIMGLSDRTGPREKNVSHDLNMKLDITYKKQLALLRKIEDAFSEATSGNTAVNINFSTDYQFSRMLNFKFYWQKQINKPLTSTSYPTVNTDFGMTLSLSLTR